MDNLKEILFLHYKWLRNEDGGIRADLCGVNLRGVNLSYANLCGVNLRYTNLRGADLRGANLRGANLSGANLSDAIANESTSGYWLACPEAGEFTAYKKCKNGAIVTLLITADSKRSSATTRKCRASKVMVISIEDTNGNPIKSCVSSYDSNFIYNTGEYVEVSNFDENRWNECSSGIHFFITKREAKIY